MKLKTIFHSEKGLSLIEVLVGMILLLIVCLSAMTYFAYGLGGIGTEGNRRAALERARERLEQVLSMTTSDLDDAAPRSTGLQYWCELGNPCTKWTSSAQPIDQNISVNDIPSRRMETVVQGVHDAAAGTPITYYDAWEIGVKVWYTSDISADDDYNRVYIRTLRAP